MAKSSQVEAEILDLLGRYEAICRTVRAADSPRAIPLIDSISASLVQMRALLQTRPRPVPLSQIRSGLRQGLRELPELLHPLLADIPTAAQAEIRAVLEDREAATAPSRSERDAAAARDVLRRGHIRDEDEWYLLRWYLDQIEGSAAHAAEVSALHRLLDSYEAPTRPPR